MIRRVVSALVLRPLSARDKVSGRMPHKPANWRLVTARRLMARRKPSPRQLALMPGSLETL